MTVGRRLTWSLVMLVACTGLLGAAACIGLVSLQRDLRISEHGYEQLRTLHEIGHHAATVRLLLNAHPPDTEEIWRQLQRAAQGVQQLSLSARSTSPRTATTLDDARHQMEQELRRIFSEPDRPSDAAFIRAEMNRALQAVSTLTAQTQSQIAANRALAGAHLQNVLIALGGLLVVAVVSAAIVGVRLHKAIMKPLRVLDRAVLRLGDEHAEREIPEIGDLEFRRVIRQFNQASAALANLHASLQDQVDVKSRQLVRSEQLASVGFLAAGLAHEINNPLGIIAGYAERLLKKLQSGDVEMSDAWRQRLASTLETVCDEAFRCRDITRELLMLARPNEVTFQPVQLTAVVERAIALVSVLPVARDREIALCKPASAQTISCHGSAGQLLQVVINLLTNALEACRPHEGRVTVTINAEPGRAMVAVNDNGCGMSPETVRHAFDPFFTDKPARGMSGSGMGLSVSHAIIERHGGRLYAHSNGPGCGSIFCIELPMYVPAMAFETGAMVS